MEYLLKRYGSLALSKRFWLHDPDHEVDASNLARWIKKRPGAASAWHLAEALRIDDQKTEPLSWSSGLLGLSWFGHWSDFVGILGTCEFAKLQKHSDSLIGMLACLDATSIVSPYDKLDINHDVLNKLTDSWRLRTVRDSLPEVISLTIDYKTEAARLNRRLLSRTYWILNDDLHQIIAAGANQWFNRNAKPSKVNEEAQDDLTSYTSSFQHATELASAKLSTEIKTNLISITLINWIRGFDILSDDVDGTLPFVAISLDSSKILRDMKILIISKLEEAIQDNCLVEGQLKVQKLTESFIDLVIGNLKIGYMPEGIADALHAVQAKSNTPPAH